MSKSKSVSKGRVSGRKKKPAMGEVPDFKEFARRKYVSDPRNPTDNPLGLPWDLKEVIAAWIAYRLENWDRLTGEEDLKFRFDIYDDDHYRDVSRDAWRQFEMQCQTQWMSDRLSDLCQAVDEGLRRLAAAQQATEAQVAA